MFYAASQIAVWIVLAAVVGGGIGWGIAQANSLRLDRRLAQGRADAPMERELATAWETIEDLNRRLQVAHETIRSAVDSESGEVTGGESVDEASLHDEPEAHEHEGDGDPVGERLSQRVASASVANQSDVEIKF